MAGTRVDQGIREHGRDRVHASSAERRVASVPDPDQRVLLTRTGANSLGFDPLWSGPGRASAEAMLQMQHVHGNFAVQRLLTSNQFRHGVGGPPRTTKLLGFSLSRKKPDPHYEALLDALDAYHLYTARTLVDQDKAEAQAKELIGLLQAVTELCAAYLDRKAPPVPSKTRSWLNALGVDVTAEKARIVEVGEAPPAGGTWKIAIGGFDESGGLTISAGTAVDITADPGVETTFKHEAPIFTDRRLTTKGATAQAGDLAIRHETASKKVVYVETYEIEVKDGSKKLTFADDGKGFVHPRVLGTSKFTHEAVGDDVPLFTRTPCIEDINQEAIGDCYLVAALGSIVAKDPDYIYGMLRENEGTPPSVTVRLYDITQRPPKAKYLQIAKSVISGNRHSAGALWVPMIEKAYAALGIASDKDNRQPTIGSKSYAQLGSGGTSDVAFGVLTGNTGFNRSGIDRGSSDLFAIPPWSESDTLNYSFLETRDADQDEMDFLRGMVSYKFFFNESKDQDTAKALTATWMKYVRQNGVQSALDAANHIGQIEMILKHPDQVEAINGASPLDDEIANALLTELEKGIPGKRGTARYTERQRQIFGAIKDALAAGRYVAVSTPATIASKQTATGQSAGEPVAKGLAGNHAYSVLAVKDDVATGRKWVRIRNPWGGDPVGYGRVYKEKGDGVLSVQQDPKVLEKKQSATFDLELSNLTKRFDNWYVSG